jgi:hypothetical protein
LPELKNDFFQQMQNLLAASVEIIMEKAKGMISSNNLTTQQVKLRGLMCKYIEVLCK